MLVQLELGAPAQRGREVTLATGRALQGLDQHEHLVTIGLELKRLVERSFGGGRIPHLVFLPAREADAQSDRLLWRQIRVLLDRFAQRTGRSTPITRDRSEALELLQERAIRG